MNSEKIDSDSLKESVYVVGEIAEPTIPRKIYKKKRYMVNLGIGLLIFAIAVIIYLYSAAIMIFRGLRFQFWRWGFASLGVALVLFYLSSIFRNDIGYGYFKNSFDKYEIQNLFGNKTTIVKPEIFAISIISKPRFLGLSTSGPYAILSTHDKTYEFPIYRYNNSDQLIQYFDTLSDTLQDEYYSIFQRVEITSHTFLGKIWSRLSGKIGLILVGFYLFFGAWGAFSMFLYPSNILTARAFFLRNPEISNSFLRGYSTQSIIYHEPNEDFLFGTDFVGRDIFSRLVYGTVHSLAVGIIATLIMMTLVILFGISAAIIGGWWDEFISRVADTLLTFPPLILMIILAAFAAGIDFDFLEQYYYYVFIGLSFLTWPQGAKLLRGETKKLLDQEYVKAAQMFGSNRLQIIKKHVIPKTAPTIILLTLSAITQVIIGMTVLGLLGLGLGSNLTWGSDLEKAINFTDVPIQDRWWTIVYPSIWVTGIIVGFTLVADTFRDLYQSPHTTAKIGVEFA